MGLCQLIGGYVKYVEQPAFETNLFKIGDKIHVYDMCYKNIDIHTITKINDDLIESNGKDILHFKQCRLVLPVRPREFWIKLDLINYSILIATPFDIGLKDEGYFKVREILED